MNQGVANEKEEKFASNVIFFPVRIYKVCIQIIPNQYFYGELIYLSLIFFFCRRA